MHNTCILSCVGVCVAVMEQCDSESRAFPDSRTLKKHITTQQQQHRSYCGARCPQTVTHFKLQCEAFTYIFVSPRSYKYCNMILCESADKYLLTFSISSDGFRRIIQYLQTKLSSACQMVLCNKSADYFLSDS